MADENIITDTEIPIEEETPQQLETETTVPPGPAPVRQRRGTVKKSPQDEGLIPLEDFFKGSPTSSGTDNGLVPLEEFFGEKKKSPFITAADLPSFWVKPPASFFGSTSFAEDLDARNEQAKAQGNKLVNGWMVLQEAQAKGISNEEAYKNIVAKASIKAPADIYRPVLKSFGENNSEEFVNRTAEQLTDWYKNESAKLDTQTTDNAAENLADKGQSRMISSMAGEQTTDDYLKNRKADLEAIHLNVIQPKIADQTNREGFGLSTEVLRRTKPAAYEHLKSAMKKGVDTRSNATKALEANPFSLLSIAAMGIRKATEGTSWNPKEQTVTDDVLEDPEAFADFMQKKSAKEVSAIIGESAAAEMEGLSHRAKYISESNRTMAFANPYDVAARQRKEELLQIAEKRKNAFSEAENARLDFEENQVQQKFNDNPDVQQYLLHQRAFIQEGLQLNNFLKKYPTVEKREKDKEAVEKEYGDRDAVSRWIMNSPMPGRPGSYGALGTGWRGLVGTGKETLKLLNMVGSFVRGEDTSSAYFENKNIDEAFEARYYVPEAQHPDTVVGYKNIPANLQNLAERLGIDEESVAGFGQPITESNFGGMMMGATESIGNMIGQAILTKGIGGALEAVGARLGQSMILKMGVPDPTAYVGMARLASQAKNVASIMGSTYAVTYAQNYQAAVDAGLEEGAAQTYANLSSIGTGLTELVNPDVKYLNKLLGKVEPSAIKSLGATLKNVDIPRGQRVLNFLKEMTLHNMAPEMAEEVVDVMKSHGLDAAFNIDTNGKALAEDMGQTALMTALTMIPMGIFGAKGHNHRLNREAMWTAGLNVGAAQNYYIDKMHEAAEQGKSEAQLQKIENEYNKVMTVANTMRDIIPSIPLENDKGRPYTLEERMELAKTKFDETKLTRDAEKAKTEELRKIAQDRAAEETQKLNALQNGTAPAYIVGNGETRKSVTRDEMIQFMAEPDYTKNKEKFKLEVYNDPEVHAMVQSANDGVTMDPEKQRVLAFNERQKEQKEREIEGYQNKLTTDLTPTEREQTNQLLKNSQRELKIIHANIDQIKKVDTNASTPTNVKYNRDANIAQTAETTTQESETETTQASDQITVGEMLDTVKVGTYKGQKGRLYQDGQTIVFKVEGQDKEYEIGNVSEVRESPISDFEIAHEASVVRADDNGNVTVRGETFVNPFEARGENPLNAIEFDDEGNVVNVRLKTADGKRRTFRGNIAEDIAYQLHLKELNKNNVKREKLTEFINEDEQTREQVINEELPELTEEKPVTDTGKVREKIEPKPKPKPKPEEPGGAAGGGAAAAEPGSAETVAAGTGEPAAGKTGEAAGAAASTTKGTAAGKPKPAAKEVKPKAAKKPTAVKTAVQKFKRFLKQQLKDFGVADEDIDATDAMVKQVFNGLKKAGLTTAKTVTDWVSIGRGPEERGSLFQPTVYGNTGLVKKPSFDGDAADAALKSGRVKEIHPQKSLGDLESFALTFWDDLFVGDIFHNGELIGSFDGGIFYPLNGGENGKMGASVSESAANIFAKQANISLFRNNGVLPEGWDAEGLGFTVTKGEGKNEWILTERFPPSASKNKIPRTATVTLPPNPVPGAMVVVKGDNLKHQSSLSAKIGLVNTLLSLSKGKKGFKGLVKALRMAERNDLVIKDKKTGEVTVIPKEKRPEGRYIYRDLIGKETDPDKLIEIFKGILKGGRGADGKTMKTAKEDYEKFRTALIEHANPLMTQLFLDMGMGKPETEQKYFDKTQLKKKEGKNYQATGLGVDSFFMDFAAEDFLKEVPSADAYAAIKITSPVDIAHDTAHPSYPYTIKTVDGSPVGVDVFSKTFKTLGPQSAIEVIPGQEPAKSGHGQQSTTVAKFRLKPDVDWTLPGSVDQRGAMGKYESVQRTKNFTSSANALKQIGRLQAAQLDYETELPQTEQFNDAVGNTEGAEITEDGLVLKTVRFQAEEQSGQESIRTGVFYLPYKDPNVRHYRGGKQGYGGKEKVEGEVLLKKPMYIKGATGGKAPENAYDSINGKGAYQKMRDEVLSVTGAYNPKVEDVARLLNKYNEGSNEFDNQNMAYEILRYSKKGNTLPYAIQENIVANAVRNAGYDSVLGYSTKRDGSHFISEIFDVREVSYPIEGEESEVHPSFVRRREAALAQGANAQYRMNSFKNIIEALKNFTGTRQGTVTVTHEIMHPTVVTIIDGARDGNAVGTRHTQTIVDEFNKANPNSPVTVDQLIQDNEDFKTGKTSEQYRAVQEFIADSWEKYHLEGATGFSASFQKVLDQITEAFKSVYKALVGTQTITPELKVFFDEILGKEVTAAIAAEPVAQETETTTEEEVEEEEKPPTPGETIAENAINEIQAEEAKPISELEQMQKAAEQEDTYNMNNRYIHGETEEEFRDNWSRENFKKPLTEEEEEAGFEEVGKTYAELDDEEKEVVDEDVKEHWQGAGYYTDRGTYVGTREEALRAFWERPVDLETVEPTPSPEQAAANKKVYDEAKKIMREDFFFDSELQKGDKLIALDSFSDDPLSTTMNVTVKAPPKRGFSSATLVEELPIGNYATFKPQTIEKLKALAKANPQASTRAISQAMIDKSYAADKTLTRELGGGTNAEVYYEVFEGRRPDDMSFKKWRTKMTQYRMLVGEPKVSREEDLKNYDEMKAAEAAKEKVRIEKQKAEDAAKKAEKKELRRGKKAAVVEEEEEETGEEEEPVIPEEETEEEVPAVEKKAVVKRTRVRRGTKAAVTTTAATVEPAVTPAAAAPVATAAPATAQPAVKFTWDTLPAQPTEVLQEKLNEVNIDVQYADRVELRRLTAQKRALERILEERGVSTQVEVIKPLSQFEPGDIATNTKTGTAVTVISKNGNIVTVQNVTTPNAKPYTVDASKIPDYRLSAAAKVETTPEAVPKEIADLYGEAAKLRITLNALQRQMRGNLTGKAKAEYDRAQDRLDDIQEKLTAYEKSKAPVVEQPAAAPVAETPAAPTQMFQDGQTAQLYDELSDKYNEVKILYKTGDGADGTERYTVQFKNGQQANVWSDKLSEPGAALQQQAGGLGANIAGLPSNIYNDALDTIGDAMVEGKPLDEAIKEAIAKHNLKSIPTFNEAELTDKLQILTGAKQAPVETEPPPQPAATPEEMANAVRSIKTPAGWNQPSVFGMSEAVYNQALDMIAEDLARGDEYGIADALNKAVGFIQSNGGGQLNEFRRAVRDSLKGMKPRVRTQVGNRMGQNLGLSRQIENRYNATANGPVQDGLATEEQGGDEPPDPGINIDRLNAERERLGLPPLKKNPIQTREMTDAATKNAMANGKIDVESELQKILDDDQYVPGSEALHMLKQYVASLSARFDDITMQLRKAREANDTAAIEQMRALQENTIKDFDFASQTVRLATSRLGRGLGMVAGSITYDESYASLMERVQQESNAGEPLTEEQKQRIENEWVKIKEAHDALNAKLDALQEKASRQEAERELKKQSGTTTSSTAAASKKKVDEAKLMIRNLLRRKRGQQQQPGDGDAALQQSSGGLYSSAQYGHSGPVPFLDHDTLAEMSPMVNEMMRGLLQNPNGPRTVPLMVEAIKNELKADIPNLTDRNVMDMLSGYGLKRQQTKTDLQLEAAALRQEMKLISRLQDLEAGVPPTDVRQQAAHTQRITDLRNKIKAAMKRQGFDGSVSAVKNRYTTRIAEINKRIADGDYTEVSSKEIVLDDEAKKLQREYYKAKEKFEFNKEKDRLKRLKRWELAGYAWDQFKGTIWALKTTFDMSALLRQGLMLGIRNPKQWAQMAKMSLKFVAPTKNAKEAYDDWHSNLMNSPYYERFVKASGLFIADQKSPELNAREEVFTANLITKIPGLKQTIAPLMSGSERAYSGGLNVLRMGVFEKAVEQLLKEGITPESHLERYQSLANYINHSTGRGDLGALGLERAGGLLGKVFFSPRFMASRLNSFNPVYWKNLSKEERIRQAIDFGTFIGTNLLLVGLFALGGGDVDDDPTSADFLKMKVGNTRIDFWTGFTPYITFAARMFMSEREGKELTPRDKSLTGTRFFQGKMAPMMGSVTNLLFGANVVGDPINLTSGEGLGNLAKGVFSPMMIETAYENYSKGDNATVGTLSTALSFLGANVQTYEANSRRGKKFKKLSKASFKKLK